VKKGAREFHNPENLDGETPAAGPLPKKGKEKGESVDRVTRCPTNGKHKPKAVIPRKKEVWIAGTYRRCGKSKRNRGPRARDEVVEKRPSAQKITAMLTKRFEKPGSLPAINRSKKHDSQG